MVVAADASDVGLPAATEGVNASGPGTSAPARAMVGAAAARWPPGRAAKKTTTEVMRSTRPMTRRAGRHSRLGGAGAAGGSDGGGAGVVTGAPAFRVSADTG